MARVDRGQHHRAMPFFEPLPPPPEPPQQIEHTWAAPRWDRPSEGTLPAVVGVSRLLGRTDVAAFALDHLRVYTNGFQLVFTGITSPRLPPELQMGGFATFSLISAVKTNQADAGEIPAPPPPRPFSPRGMRDMAPRVGVRFSNGQTAGRSSASTYDVAKDDDGVPSEPVIVAGGFNGGGGRFRFEQWVFPLPTPGPLEVIAEWSQAGMEETSIVISGDEVREAAQRAIVLWS